jgi:hypothetical protein
MNRNRQETKQMRRIGTSRNRMCHGCGSGRSQKENDEPHEKPAKNEAQDGEIAKSAERIICGESADEFQLRDFVLSPAPKNHNLHP